MTDNTSSDSAPQNSGNNVQPSNLAAKLPDPSQLNQPPTVDLTNEVIKGSVPKGLIEK